MDEQRYHLTGTPSTREHHLNTDEMSIGDIFRAEMGSSGCEAVITKSGADEITHEIYSPDKQRVYVFRRTESPVTIFVDSYDESFWNVVLQGNTSGWNGSGAVEGAEADVVTRTLTINI